MSRPESLQGAGPVARLVGRVARGYGFADPRAWPLFLRYFHPHRRALAGYALGASLVSLLLLPVVWLIRWAFDHAIPAGKVGELAAVGAAIVGIRLLGSGAALLLRRHVVHVIKSAVACLREDLLLHVYRAPREHLGRADLDRLQSRIVQETERVDVMSNALLSGVLPALVSSLALGVVLAWSSPSLVGLAVLLLPLAWFATSRTSRIVARDVGSFRAAFESFNKGMSFVLRQLDLTRVQACEPEEIARQRAHIDRLRADGERMAWSFALHGQLQANVTGLIGIGLLVAGGIEVARGVMTLGALLAFYFGAGLLNGFVSTAMRGTADVIAGSVSLATLADILEYGEPHAYRGRETHLLRGGFELREVTFRHGNEPVLRAASLRIEPGSVVAVVGPNGAGKTTVLNLLLGLAAPQGGEVRVDGRPYHDIDLAALRRQCGVVLQRHALFHGSIRDNLLYGNDGASEAQMVEAARRAGADEFVRALPDGYDTQVGEGGVRISGGESQRLAIARALLREPRVLLLDEPTNHLDVAAVHGLLAGLRALPARPTVVLVSHDERLVGAADHVWRLEDGRLHPVGATRRGALAAAEDDSLLHGARVLHG